MELIGGNVPITSYFRKAASAELAPVHAKLSSNAVSSTDTASKPLPGALETHMSRLFGSKPKMQTEKHHSWIAEALRAGAGTEDAVEVVEDTPSAVASAWSSDDVDENVLAELPWDIQQEIRSQMRQPQHRNTSQSGGENVQESEEKQQGAKRRRVVEDTARTVVAEIIID